MKRLLDSLFSRLIVVLVTGLLLALLLTLWINMEDRDELLSATAGRQVVQRIADTVQLLDVLDPAEREKIIRIINVPPQQAVLSNEPLVSPQSQPPNEITQGFANLLIKALGKEHKILVQRIEVDSTMQAQPESKRSMDMMHGWRYGMENGWRHGMENGRRHGVESGEKFVPGRYSEQQLRQAQMVSFVVQVQLRDGQWAIFDTTANQDMTPLSWRLPVSLFVLFGVVVLLSFIAVRWLTRPLNRLAQAAQALGQDINQPPLVESGPKEIRQAAHAFNTMQKKLQEYIQERTQIFAAMSHDLKTPITRMRLRVEMLGEEGLDTAALRQRFEDDLEEMQAMVLQALDFMKGIDASGVRQSIDMNALLESMQADYQQVGKSVEIQGRALRPYVGDLLLLKRCFTNLLDNAIFYGHRADVCIEDSAQCLTIRVRDEGAGLNAAEMEKVFTPFYRVEGSRNRATGGTGLGLSIVRNIARLHNAEVALRNRPEGGLEVSLHFYRVPQD